MQTIIVVPVIVCIFYGKFLGRTNAVCRIWATYVLCGYFHLTG